MKVVQFLPRKTSFFLKGISEFASVTVKEEISSVNEEKLIVDDPLRITDCEGKYICCEQIFE